MAKLGLLKFTAIFLVATFLTCCSDGFSEEDLHNMKKSIRDEFSKRPNVEVVEVVMLKESSKKAHGFAKIRVPMLGEITKPCSATMGEDKANYIWRCD